MKIKNHLSQTLTGLVFGVAVVFGATALQAQPTTLGQIGARALTPQEIKDYGLPATTQVSGGLYTVGVGQPLYLEAQVRSTVPASNILGTTWTLVAKPFGSLAAFEPTPITTNMPIYNPGDRGFYQVAGRTLLRPDLVGTYTITALVATNGGSFVITQKVTGGTYLGAHVCRLCHSGGTLPDTYTPYSQTHHATAFTNAIDGWSTDHFAQYCVKCHAVGYDANALAVNAGFDDIQAQTGWVMPTNFVPGNFAAMPQALREKSNVQCENCHGPGSQHFANFGDASMTSVSFSAGDCAQCHAAEPYHLIGVEWESSLHAVATRSPTGEGRASCVRCHSAMGFVDFAAGVPESQRRTAYEAITCAACHDPHGEANNPHLLRKIDTVTLMDNVTTITNGGLGQLCMNCHMSRREAISYVDGTSTNSNVSAQFGPHHGPQADMLAGANAYTYGKEIASSAHSTAVKDTCVACHLQVVGATDPAFGLVGGHTFRNHYDNGTNSFTLVELCSNCHGDIETFDFKRTDYDGDGTVEGVQTEVKGLLEQVALLLPPVGSTNVSSGVKYTRPQLRALFNYKFVLEDGSYGAHNLSYAVGLLKASIADLTDDVDYDGISDQWEIDNFGSITLYDGFSDPDNDGVKNSLEMSAKTNPLLADTDGDGINDLAELEAGSDPINPADKPGFVVKIFTAAEIEFASELGKQYQVQRVSDLTGAWVNMGSVTNGTGNNISMVTSTRTGGTQNYFRVVQVQTP
jgi:hypothetical protein